MDTLFDVDALRGRCHALLAELRGMGYRESTLNGYAFTLDETVSFAAKRFAGGSFTAKDLEDSYAKFVDGKRIGPSAKRGRVYKLGRLADFLEGTEYRVMHSQARRSVPDCLSEGLESYASDCSSRGNKDITIAGKTAVVIDFLWFIWSLGAKSPSDAGPSEIIGFLKGKPVRFYTCTKDYLSFLFRTGTTDVDRSFFVAKPHRSVKLPSCYSVSEIAAMERAIGGTPRDTRNRAIFLLASEDGMRIGDIVGLRLGDFDLGSSRVSFRQLKTGGAVCLPLSEKLSEALKAWLSVRPECRFEEAFISLNGPLRPVSSSIATEWLQTLMKKAGIAVAGRKHGPHSLRSSLASNMVNSGVPYEAVRKALGHSSRTALEHYAKIDVANLRRYSLEPIAPSGRFAEEIA